MSDWGANARRHVRLVEFCGNGAQGGGGVQGLAVTVHAKAVRFRAGAFTACALRTKGRGSGLP